MDPIKSQEINQLLRQVNIFKNTIERVLWNPYSSEGSKYLSYKEMAIAYNNLVKKSIYTADLSNYLVVIDIEKIGENYIVSNLAKKQILEHIFTHSDILYSTLDEARFNHLITLNENEKNMILNT